MQVRVVQRLTVQRATERIYFDCHLVLEATVTTFTVTVSDFGADFCMSLVSR